MKTLFLSTSDFLGGAARATYWLGKGLRSRGLDLSMIVQNKSTSEDWVETVKRGNYGKLLSILRLVTDTSPLKLYSNRKNIPWSLNWLPNSNLHKKIDSYNADITNIHWIGEGFLPMSLLQKIKTPIVWSLYDMWPFTGGCHYDEFCGKFISGCGKCPQLSSSHYDLSSLVLAQKLKYLKDLPITVVAPSLWLAGEAKKSLVFKDKRIEVIPHGTNLEIFSPLDKGMARRLLGLDEDRSYILFGAMGGSSDARKGYQHLTKALQKVSSNKKLKNTSLMIFGSNGGEDIQGLDFPVHKFGRFVDDIALSVLYSAADITVTPSMQEAFGMTASESMACGTPVVAFGTSGPMDVIDHKVDGYLANPFDYLDLATGIEWLLDGDINRIASALCRKKCQLKFDLRDVSKKYESLYTELLSK